MVIAHSNILHTPQNILCTPQNILCIPPNILCTPSHIQVGLLLYLANMFKATKASLLDLQAQLEKMATVPQSSPCQRDGVGAHEVYGPVNSLPF